MNLISKSFKFFTKNLKKFCERVLGPFPLTEKAVPPSASHVIIFYRVWQARRGNKGLGSTDRLLVAS